MQERYIASVDLGTSKLALCVAKVTGENVQVIYYREKPAVGVRYSAVYSPGKATASLREAIAEAESELGLTITQVVVGLPRFGVHQVSASARLDRSQPDDCISSAEIEMLKECALTSYPLGDPNREEIYGAVAQSFSADDLIQQSEDDMIGSVADSMDGNFKIFVGSKRASTNLDRMFNDAGVGIERKLFTPCTTAEAILTEEEKSNGVGLIEIGAGVTSLTIYQGGIMRHYSAIPFGAGNVTADIKYECGFKESLAENIKLAYGACMPEKLQSLGEKTIRITDEETGQYDDLPAKYLSEIITCRMREIMEAMLFLIQEAGFTERLRNGLVLTGGGANMANLCAMVRDMSGYSVRLGYPRSRSFSYQGCSGITETGAASSIGIILNCRKDLYLNCVEDNSASMDQMLAEQPVPAAEAPAYTAAPAAEAPAEDTYIQPAYTQPQPVRTAPPAPEVDIYGGLGESSRQQAEPDYGGTVFGSVSKEDERRIRHEIWRRNQEEKKRRQKEERERSQQRSQQEHGTISWVKGMLEKAFDGTVGSIFDDMGKDE